MKSGLLSAVAVYRWCWLHKWTSLICTIFLLMLCVTGLPLIFHGEIDRYFSTLQKAADLPANTPHLSFDRIIAAARASRAGEFVHIVTADPDEPEHLYVGVGKTADAPLDKDTGVFVDTRNAKILGEQRYGEGSFIQWVLKLHVEMFAGLPGKLFLGAMGVFFLIAIISGIVIYAPFMRERSFGVVRRNRAPRLRWLDLHNLLGISVAVWILVVGATGVINTWADLLIKIWQIKELGAMIAPYRNLPPLTEFASFDKSLESAKKAVPTMNFSFAAFPGTAFSSPHHYAFFMRGRSALTSRLIKPVLVDAQTGNFSATREMPWYITALLLSQPLHFGDYGGLPLKIIWAALDLVAILVLGSGVYLWWKRRKIPIEIDLRPREPSRDFVETQSTEPSML
ncbi:MAG TPA: PepSY-associated TM helix domain-containing protein [Candidatus Udaeobacter sp.]|jgi:uncharacterized iron-regulated membrane protein|nr:PepSY-associated TM helix domain-containing protein [Candidatus Udaeobacter sp.]